MLSQSATTTKVKRTIALVPQRSGVNKQHLFLVVRNVRRTSIISFLQKKEMTFKKKKMNKRILPQRRRWIKQEERKQMQRKSASSFFGILTIIDLFISLFVLICSEHHECHKILGVKNARNKLNFKLRNKLNKHNKDNKLNFNEHLKGVLDKMSKSVGLIRKFHSTYSSKIFIAHYL